MISVGSTALLRSMQPSQENCIVTQCAAVRRYANMTLEAGYRTVLSISRASSYGSGWYLPPFCGAFTSLFIPAQCRCPALLSNCHLVLLSIVHAVAKPPASALF